MQVSVTTRNSSVSLYFFALCAIFAATGLLIGSWASRIPALQAGLGISHSSLSLVLLCGGLGGLVSYPFAAKSMMHFGGRKTMLLGALALSASLLPIGWASSMASLMMAVLTLGISAGIYGVGVTSVAARVERASGKSSMSMLHAWGCGGSLLGALIGSFMAARSISPLHHFLVVAPPMAMLCCLCAQVMNDDIEEAGENIEKKRFALPSGPLMALGILVFCMSMSEATIADWSGVFLKSHFGVTDGFAPLALSCFTLLMLLSRLFGDKLKTTHGAHRLITAGAMLSALGLFFAVFAPNPYIALFGFGCSGAGLALVTPFVFSAAGQQGTMATAAVATMGSIGNLMGPPIMGFAADHFGLQLTMGLVAALSLVIVLVAPRSSMLK